MNKQIATDDITNVPIIEIVTKVFLSFKANPNLKLDLLALALPMKFLQETYFLQIKSYLAIASWRVSPFSFATVSNKTSISSEDKVANFCVSNVIHAADNGPSLSPLDEQILFVALNKS